MTRAIAIILTIASLAAGTWAALATVRLMQQAQAVVEVAL